jgi:hypothetical protein
MVHNLGLCSTLDTGVTSIDGMLRIPLHFDDLPVTHMNQHTTFNMTSLANTSDDFIHCSSPFIWGCFDDLYFMLSFTFPLFRFFPAGRE